MKFQGFLLAECACGRYNAFDWLPIHELIYLSYKDKYWVVRYGLFNKKTIFCYIVKFVVSINIH